jgi:hypothetical protein
MKLRLVEPRKGSMWARDGLRLFARFPFIYSAYFTGFMLLGMIVLSVPIVGVPLVLTALPWASLIFMLISKRLLQGLPLTFSVLREPFMVSAAQTRALLQLCAVYALLTLLGIMLCDWLDGGKLAMYQNHMAKDDDRAAMLLFQDNQLRLGLLFRIGIALLMAWVFWFAPAAIYWGRQTWLQSLFSSAIACWQNRGAFLRYLLSWAAMLILLMLLVNILFLLLGVPAVVSVGALSGGLLISTAFYASLYFTFADCFEEKPEIMDRTV